MISLDEHIRAVFDGKDLAIAYNWTIPKELVPKNEFNNSDKPDRAKDDINNWLNKQDIAFWGDDNILPQQALQKMKAVPLAMAAMKFRISVHFGRGLILYKQEVTSENKVSKIPVIDNNDWNDFASQNNIDIFQARVISDWEWFRNQFIQIVLSKDGKKINKIYRLPAMHCRWKKPATGEAIPKKLFLSARWGFIEKQQDVKDIPVLDFDYPLDDLRERIKKGDVARKFILPINFEELGNTLYDEPYWMSILNNWLKIAAAIPGIKEAMMRNQMVLKFHIKIPYTYWTNKYKDWNNKEKFPVSKQQEIINKELDDLQEFLTDTENYGKSFISHYGVDPLKPNVKHDEWKIEVVDNTKMAQDGQHIIDASAANSEICTAIGVDPTLLGGFLPGGSEAGSGSNKREAFSILQASMWLDRMFTLKWYDYVADYNGWDKSYKLGYIDIDTSETLSQNPTGKKEVL